MAATAFAREPKPMEWTHSETIGLSNVKCVKCEGTGFRPGTHRDGKTPCNCVLRNIFRACLSRLYACNSFDNYIARVEYNFCPGHDASRSWTHKTQDYAADFYLIAKRTLTEREFAVLRLHYLLRHDWNACCNFLRMDRGAFFHICYRVEQKLGRAYREVRPYSLFPCDEYFGGTLRRKAAEPFFVDALRTKHEVIRPPVRKAA
jgi:hypothetical protein